VTVGGASSLPTRAQAGWLAMQYKTEVMYDGVLASDTTLWDRSGAVVAQARQLAMILPFRGVKSDKAGSGS